MELRVFGSLDLDLETLASAPPAMTRAGLGDCVARFISYGDWYLAHQLGLVDRYSETPLALMGADLRVVNHRSAGTEPVADIEVRPAQLKGIHVPEHLVPLAIDEFPVLFIAAACAEGETLVTGAEELRVKESDRIAVMAEGLSAMGVECEVLRDGIRIQGRPKPAVFSGGDIDSHGDHRIAMSFSVASLRAAAPIRIADVANVATSFPDFPGVARAAGLNVELI